MQDSGSLDRSSGSIYVNSVIRMIVSAEYIIEEYEGDPKELPSQLDGVCLRYNDTEPSVQRDGVDLIAILDDEAEGYCVDYRGFVSGRLRVTAEGVEEIGKRLVSHDGEVPNWTLNRGTINGENLPWWVPDSAMVHQTVACDRCKEQLAVEEVVTPRRDFKLLEGNVFCWDCFYEARGKEPYLGSGPDRSTIYGGERAINRLAEDIGVNDQTLETALEVHGQIVETDYVPPSVGGLSTGCLGAAMRVHGEKEIHAIAPETNLDMDEVRMLTEDICDQLDLQR